VNNSLIGLDDTKVFDMGTLISSALRGNGKQNALHWLKKQPDKIGGSVIGQ
jgi:hypothetical protein